MKVEEIGDPVCCNTQRATGIDVRTFLRHAQVVLHVGIIVAGDSDKDTGIGASQALGHKRSILQRFPRKLEQQALLRIDIGRLSRRYAEKICVKEVDLIEQAGIARIDSTHCRIGMMVAEIPAVTPDFAHSIHARLEIAPQARKVVGTAGIAATHPDYSDCSTRTGCHIGTPFTQLRLEIVHSCYSAPHLRWRLPDTNPN
jgi:hypothetical protein